MEFTLTETWFEGGPQPLSITVKRGELVLTDPAGGEADDIPASLFGFNKIIDCGAVVADDDDELYLASPASDSNSLLIGGTDVAVTESGGIYTAVPTAGLMDLPAGTYHLTIRGR